MDLLSARLKIFKDITATAQNEEIAGKRVRVASTEGLILLKLVAFRVQDQADLLALVAANSTELDLEILQGWYQQVGTLADGRWQWFLDVLREVEDI